MYVCFEVTVQVLMFPLSSRPRLLSPLSETFSSSLVSHCNSWVMTLVRFPEDCPRVLIDHSLPAEFHLTKLPSAHHPVFYYHLHFVTFINLCLFHSLTFNVTFFCVSLLFLSLMFPYHNLHLLLLNSAVMSHLSQPFINPSVTRASHLLHF